MKTKLFIILTFLFVITADSQTILNIGMAPMFPQELQNNDKKVMPLAFAEYLKSFDKFLSIGSAINFAWQTNDSSVTYYDTSAQDSVTEKLGTNKTFMLPFLGILQLDPLNKKKIHPVLRGGFGLNIMIRDVKDYDIPNDKIIKNKANGFYIGFTGKAGGDVVFDFTPNVSLLAGFEYQWGKLRHKVKNTTNKYIYYDFNGPVIRGGLSIYY